MQPQFHIHIQIFWVCGSFLKPKPRPTPKTFRSLYYFRLSGIGNQLRDGQHLWRGDKPGIRLQWNQCLCKLGIFFLLLLNFFFKPIRQIIVYWQNPTGQNRLYNIKKFNLEKSFFQNSVCFITVSADCQTMIILVGLGIVIVGFVSMSLCFYDYISPKPNLALNMTAC